MESIMSEAVIVATGLAVIIRILMEGVKKAEFVNNKYIPLIAMVVGLVIGLAIALSYGFNIGVYVIAGIIGGAGATGLYETTKK